MDKSWIDYGMDLGGKRGHEIGMAKHLPPPEGLSDPDRATSRDTTIATRNGNPIASPHFAKSDTKTMVRSVIKGWLTDPEDIRWCYLVLKKIAVEGKDERARANAAKGAADVLQRSIELGIKLAEFEDKTQRLDAGEATENTGVVFDVRMPEPRDRI